MPLFSLPAPAFLPQRAPHTQHTTRPLKRHISHTHEKQQNDEAGQPLSSKSGYYYAHNTVSPEGPKTLVGATEIYAHKALDANEIKRIERENSASAGKQWGPHTRMLVSSWNLMCAGVRHESCQAPLGHLRAQKHKHTRCTYVWFVAASACMYVCRCVCMHACIWSR